MAVKKKVAKAKKIIGVREEAYHLVVRLNDRYSCVVDEAHLERAEMLKDRADNYQYPDDYSKPVTCHIERKIDWKG
jgi:hypothetical protein